MGVIYAGMAVSDWAAGTTEEEFVCGKHIYVKNNNKKEE